MQLLLKRITNKGFTILEVTFAIGLFSIGLLSIGSLMLQNIKVQDVNKNNLTASMLAQEGLELVRNQRDRNWITDGANWDDDLNHSGGHYVIDIEGMNNASNNSADFTSEAAARLYINASGYYVHNGVGTTPTIFYRKIFTDLDSDSIKVTSVVQWKDRGFLHNYTAMTLLYNWR